MSPDHLEDGVGLFRFGPFEFDPRSGELRKHGRRLRLQSKPRLVLHSLLERPGQFVTREELRSRLWPGGITVDFDNSLNTALSRLRFVLSDSAAHPRFLVTVDRRGYRFVGPVEVIRTAERPPAEAVRPRSSLAEDPPPVTGAAQGSALEDVPPGGGRWAKTRGWSLVLPLAAVLLLAVPALWMRSPRALPGGSAAAPRIQSIAVLPLVELGAPANDQLFAEALTDALIGELGSIGALRVPSHRSVARYRGTTEPLSVIARSLNVDAIAEGTVWRVADRAHIGLRLFEARSERQIWAGTYERSLTDVLTVQGEIAARLALEIAASTTPAEQRRLGRERRVNPEAYEAYVKGRFLWNKRTEDGLRKSVEHFETAVRKDPGYAAAWAGLAGAYGPLASFGFLSPREARAPMRRAGLKAVELDPDSAEAHTELAGLYHNFEWDWSEAERLYRKAISLDPTYATAWQRLGQLLVLTGRIEEGLAATRRARQLEPDSLSIATSMASRLYLARRHEEALRELVEAERLDSTFTLVHLGMGQTLMALRRHDQARQAFERAERLSPTDVRVQVCRAYLSATIGHRSEAEALYRHLEERQGARYVPAYQLALIDVALGRRDRAMAQLERAFGERSPSLASLAREPMLDPVRDHPRFAALLARMQFPPATGSQ